MPQVTIRNVPEDVRDELKARAAAQRMSMQEFLLAELERLAALPPRSAVVDRIRARKRVSEARIDRSAILAHRDADRR